VKGPLLALVGAGPQLQGGGQGSRVGRETAQQLLALARVLAAKGIERIGAGGRLGESPQQFPPLGCGRNALGFQGQGVSLQGHSGQWAWSPALPLQQLALAGGIVAAAGGQQQQAGLPAPLGIGIPAADALQAEG